MASPSPWRRWPWLTTINNNNDSPIIKLSSSSIIFPFRIIPTNPTRLSTLCLDPSSSSSSSSSSLSPSTDDHAPNNAKTRTRKSVKLVQFGDNSSNGVAVRRANQSRNRPPVLTSRSLFGRRSLWRRILFASRKVRSIILLNVLTVIWASDIPVLKEVEEIMDPAAFNVVRFAISAIPFLPFVLRARGDVQTRNAGIELGFWVSLGCLMQALGLLTSDAGRASFISMFTVILVPLLDGMLGATIPARTWFGALMSLVGVAMLECSGSPPSVGDLLNFLSAVFFGVHMLRTEHISRSTNKENFLPILGYQVCVVALFSTLWYFIGGFSEGIQEGNPSSWTWAMLWDWMVAFPWIPALYTGIFSTGLCLWIEMEAMLDVSATETAIIYGLEPVWGAGFAWFLLGERWGVAGWIGAVLVLGGSLTVQVFGSSSPTMSGDSEESNRNGDQLLVPDKKAGLSASPIVVSSRKEFSSYQRREPR